MGVEAEDESGDVEVEVEDDGCECEGADESNTPKDGASKAKRRHKMT